MPIISIIVSIYNVEKYLREALESIESQSFKCFEVIMIDDGSSDASFSIMKEFVNKDERFLAVSQENRGVAFVRNKGMELAKGEYLVFCDGDDVLPHNSFENFYNSIVRENGDIAVGIMQVYDNGISVKGHSTEELAAQKTIDASDINFIKTWSVCNKIYRVAFLRENNITFKDMKVAEDGEFIYQILSKNPKICGCNHIVYTYKKRTFWSGQYSASAAAGSELLKERVKAYDSILELANIITQGLSFEKKAIYTSRLVTRFIVGGIIESAYRRIWRCDDSIEKELQYYLSKYKKLLQERDWQKLCKDNWDIDLERICEGKVQDTIKDKIVKEPIVSVIFSNYLNVVEISLLLSSLYNQMFPNFEIVLDRERAAQIENSLIGFKNIRIVPKGDLNEYINQSRGQYIYMADAVVVFNKTALLKMVDFLNRKKQLDFVSVYIKSVPKDFFDRKEQENNRINIMDAIFGYSKRSRCQRAKINDFDNLFANKLFRRECLEKCSFYGDEASDVIAFYETRKFEKSRKIWFSAVVQEKDLIDRSFNKHGKLKISYLKFQNRLIYYIAKVMRKIKVIILRYKQTIW